ncbi:MAG: ClpXP protease specificity-enhancing factor SspB [Polyangiaceae bacterium]
MSSVQPLPPKKEVALALLERSSVHIHLDPRAPGVLVPIGFKSQPQLVLQVGLNMPVPIPDLRLDEDGLSCTLSFNRAPFHCVVPWKSVYAMVGDDGRGMVWPDDVPPEVERQAPARSPVAAAPPPTERPVRAVAAKKSAKKSQLDDTRADDPSKSRKPRKKPRVVPTPRDEQRARLVAVPPPAVSDPRPPTRSSRDAPAHAGTPPRAPQRGPKPKRELPPYLRVVK